jgi:flagellar biosynthesis GTPase FlhF
MKKVTLIIAIISIMYCGNTYAQDWYDVGYSIGSAARNAYDQKKAREAEEARQQRLQEQQWQQQQADANRQAAERQAEANRQAAVARQIEETKQSAAKQAAQQQEQANAIKAYNYAEKTLTLNDDVCFLKNADENCDLIFELLSRNGKYYIYSYNNYNSFLTLKANFMTILVTYNDGTTKTIDKKLNKSFEANSEQAIPVFDNEQEDLSNVSDVSIIFDRSVLQ